MAVTGHRAVRNVAIRRCNPLGPQHGRCGKRTYGAEWIASLFSLLLFWHQPRRDAEPYTLSMTCDNTQNLQLGLDCSEKPSAQFMAVFGPYSTRITQILERYPAPLIAAAAASVDDDADREIPLRPEERTT